MIMAATAGKSPAGLTMLFTEAPRYDARAWMDNRDRFPSGSQIIISEGPDRRPLVAGFVATADPEISFDGKRVVFAGRQKTGDAWRVWEAGLDGSAPRLVSAGAGDCYRPLYLPDERVVWTRRMAGGSRIEIAPLSGEASEPLSFAPGQYLTADVLHDGRILFETVHAYGGTAVREIMTVYPDGTGVEAVRCDHGADRHSPRQSASGDILFIDNGRLARFTSPLAQEVAVDPPPAGILEGPVADAGDGGLIISIRQSARQRLRLARWSPAARTLIDIAAARNMNAVEPVIVAPRPAPKRFPSALVATRTAGNLLCLNAAISREPLNGVPLHAVRVYTRNDAGGQVLLGTQPIEKDGSFFVQLPADKPLRLETLDAAGKVIRAERNWWWMRAAEQRCCVGCHAGPERAPDNAAPQVLERRDVPVKMLTPEKH